MEEKCMGLKKEVALQEKQTGDVDRQLDETTRELHREDVYKRQLLSYAVPQVSHLP